MNDTFLWSGLSLITNLNARLIGQLPPGVTGISIDSRTIAPGELFFAIKGDNSNGHDYVDSAFANGAAAAVVDEAHADAAKKHGPVLVVNDVQLSLENLGEASRLRSRAGIIGVTGSVGKTSTKEALALVLSHFGKTHAAVASYNNHWGVPLTLSRMPQDCDFGIFEIGMNHPGEITPLTRMVAPHVAIVTTVAAVHMASFNSVDEIADAKGEIFSGLQPHGVAIIHRDIPQYERLRNHARSSAASEVLSFGEAEEADARLVDYSEDGETAIVEAWILGEHLRYRLGARGRHMAINSLAVLLGARALGVDVAEAAKVLGEYSAPKGRGARAALPVGDGTFTLIDESYNANPASVRAALAVLGNTAPAEDGRRIAVIADMLELGARENELHAELAADVESNNVDLLYCAGPLSKYLYDAVGTGIRGRWAEKAAGLVVPLIDELRAGDVIMLKGSNGSRLGPVVQALREHFSGGNEKDTTGDAPSGEDAGSRELAGHEGTG